MFLYSLLSFAVLIIVLVTVHELGHLIAARANGVMVEAFSVGMGPVLWKKKDKFGTEWRISLLPIGGYVKMLGDADATSVREKIPDNVSEEDMEKFSIHRKKPYQRLIVAAAGPIMNLIFAIVCITALATIKGLPVPSNIINVVPNTIADVAGLANNDRIIKINNKGVKNFNEIRREIVSNKSDILVIAVKRNSEEKEFIINMLDQNNVRQQVIGITNASFDFMPLNVVDAFLDACKITYKVAYENIKGIAKIVTGQQSYKNAGGVISIAQMASNSAKSGFADFVWIICLLSIVLGAVNLLPIPMLDGGTIIISMLEWIIGRPINKKFIEYIFYVGFVIVVALMLIGLWNDINRLPFFQKLLGIK